MECDKETPLGTLETILKDNVLETQQELPVMASEQDESRIVIHSDTEVGGIDISGPAAYSDTGSNWETETTISGEASVLITASSGAAIATKPFIPRNKLVAVTSVNDELKDLKEGMYSQDSYFQ